VDESEAEAILEAEIARLRSLGYDGLQRFLRADAHQIRSASGTLYNIETQAFPDDARWFRKRSGILRVMVSIDDGHGRRAFHPLTDDFIIAPDGTFVGEAESPSDRPAG
jgi:hypothetical protein